MNFHICALAFCLGTAEAILVPEGYLPSTRSSLPQSHSLPLINIRGGGQEIPARFPASWADLRRCMAGILDPAGHVPETPPTKRVKAFTETLADTLDTNKPLAEPTATNILPVDPATKGKKGKGGPVSQMAKHMAWASCTKALSSLSKGLFLFSALAFSLITLRSILLLSKDAKDSAKDREQCGTWKSKSCNFIHGLIMQRFAHFFLAQEAGFIGIIIFLLNFRFLGSHCRGNFLHGWIWSSFDIVKDGEYITAINMLLVIVYACLKSTLLKEAQAQAEASAQVNSLDRILAHLGTPLGHRKQ